MDNFKLYAMLIWLEDNYPHVLQQFEEQIMTLTDEQLEEKYGQRFNEDMILMSEAGMLRKDDSE